MKFEFDDVKRESGLGNSCVAAGFTTGEEPSRPVDRDDLAAGEETVGVDLQEEEFQTDFDGVRGEIDSQHHSTLQNSMKYELTV
ncbi:unnamed protein product [Sphenostylis stenocarpa]|uniref:Uncharacterized protein n=1 Tax=Sphenostylis stenocarpa TaxID=92480 RepID=A0AA86SCE8_9FABA|nr:unnamed protein product [Sphenostylis stenocarpa]